MVGSLRQVDNFAGEVEESPSGQDEADKRHQRPSILVWVAVGTVPRGAGRVRDDALLRIPARGRKFESWQPNLQ